jgi:hypothetical protein
MPRGIHGDVVPEIVLGLKITHVNRFLGRVRPLTGNRRSAANTKAAYWPLPVMTANYWAILSSK